MTEVDPNAEAGLREEDFLARWSRRKQENGHDLAESDDPSDEGGAADHGDVADTVEVAPPGDEDMPPLESLDEGSDYTGFLSPGVSDQLRRLALRKLFHGATFNVCDGLDDYADDFTNFAKLGEIVTADMRHRLQEEVRKRIVAEDVSGEASERKPQSETGEGGDEEGASSVQKEEDGHSRNPDGRVVEGEFDDELADEDEMLL